MTRPLTSERGSASVEAAIGVPAFLLLVGLLVLGGRTAIAQQAVQAAASDGVPVAALNLGRTRADDLLSLKIEQPCAAALAFLLPSASTA